MMISHIYVVIESFLHISPSLILTVILNVSWPSILSDFPWMSNVSSRSLGHLLIS